MAHTQQEYIGAYLTKLGFNRVENVKTKKYHVYKCTDKDKTFFFVGNKGALRMGMNVSESHAAPQKVHNHFLEEGKKLLDKQ